MEQDEYHNKEDRPVPVMGEEIDFREDAKHEHAWIHWTKPNPKASLPGKDAETKYDIIEIASPPNAQ